MDSKKSLGAHLLSGSLIQSPAKLGPSHRTLRRGRTSRSAFHTLTDWSDSKHANTSRPPTLIHRRRRKVVVLAFAWRGCGQRIGVRRGSRGGRAAVLFVL